MLATGLNPVVTSVGYSTGFVPSRYQFHSIEEAVENITKTMLRLGDDNNRTNSISKQRIERVIWYPSFLPELQEWFEDAH